MANVKDTSKSTAQPDLEDSGTGFHLDERSIGLVETQYYTFAEPPNELELECGRKLGPVTLAYETYGTLNEDRSNAILVVHALSGDAHVAGYHSPQDMKPGWWDIMVGPGKGFDTNKYFVICSNVLGGCRGSTGPASINPETGQPYGLSFPIITIGDMVKAQRHLIDLLGINQLLSVAGGSMGGMQTLEWMTRYPERLKSSIAIASTPSLSPQALAFDTVGRHAIQGDPSFQNGDYYSGGVRPETGLAIARMLGHITYLSDESMRAKFGRNLRNATRYSYDFSSEFSVETYLDHQGESFVNRFDANSYMYLTKAIDYFDLGAAHGSLDEAMQKTTCKVLVVAYTSDWLYPPYQSESVVYALMRQRGAVNYVNIESDYGHDAFLLEAELMEKLVGGFVDHVYDPDKVRREELLHADSQEDLGPPAAAAENIYEGHRVDYDMIVDQVHDKSRVLDLGCGGGQLLQRLIAVKNVDGMGIEISQGNVVTCVRRGVAVVHADVDQGLNALPDQSFDYVILSMTLQVIMKPEFVINEMLRVGKKCIVSFPNFAYWKVRAKTLLLGRAPVTRNLPFAWHKTQNRSVLSIQDFREFCEKRQIHIEKELPLSSKGASWAAHLWPNLMGEEALFVITRK